MTTAGCHTNLAIEVPKREVLRYMGYRQATQVSRRVAERLETLWPLAERMLAPVGIFRIVSGIEAAAAGMPRPTETVGIGLCTIGPALEDGIQEHIARGRTLEALILDAYGSAAAEATADALDLLLSERIGAMGLSSQRRISPGYGKWDVSCQVPLLALLPMVELGIRLTEGCMMVPRKSVSFAVRCVRAMGQRLEQKHGCETCDLAGCSFRDAPSGEGRPAGRQ